MCGFVANGSTGLASMATAGLAGIIFLPLVGLAVWAALRWRHLDGFPLGMTPTAAAIGVAPSPVAILRERYARGEIDLTTFERMLAQLNRSTLGPDSQESPPRMPRMPGR